MPARHSLSVVASREREGKEGEEEVDLKKFRSHSSSSSLSTHGVFELLLDEGSVSPRNQINSRTFWV